MEAFEEIEAECEVEGCTESGFFQGWNGNAWYNLKRAGWSYRKEAGELHCMCPRHTEERTIPLPVGMTLDK